MTHKVDLAVIGGGITGLAAAWEAHRQGAEVMLVDAADRVGGKLATSSVAGIPIDESADAFLARMPDAVELCDELGLRSELIAPATGRAFVWSEGALRALPSEQLLGVPTDVDAIAASGILSPAGLARLRDDLAGNGPASHGTDADGSVGALIRDRLGDEVLERLVAPLVGGIWAGDCDRLSLATTAPTLAEASRRDASLVRGAAAVRATTTPDDTDGRRPPAPTFLAPKGGMSRLVEALTVALGDRLHRGRPVQRLERPSGRGARGSWRLEPAGVTADAVVVATPAFHAAPLVEPHSPVAASTLAAIEHASIVLVTLAVPRAGIDHPLDGSGFLVPPGDRHLLTTCSWLSSKWEHLAGDGTMALLRASAGRDGDARALSLNDATLVAQLCDDLRQTMGLQAKPVAARVNRWARAFPQPRPGHLARVAALEAALAHDAPGLALAGAWSRGLGIPACVRSGRRAAAHLLGVPSSAPHMEASRQTGP